MKHTRMQLRDHNSRVSRQHSRARKVAAAPSRARPPEQADKRGEKGVVNITQIHGRWRPTQEEGRKRDREGEKEMRANQ